MDLKFESVKFFNSQEGKNILEKYSQLNINDLPALALKLSKQGTLFSSELTTLLKLRKKSISKFTRAEKMFFTSDSLEQASSESMSQYIAKRFKDIIREGTVTDLTCGLGTNSIFLAKYFQLRSVDINKLHLTCAKHNAIVYGVRDNIEFIEARAEDSIQASKAYIIDPQRIRFGQTKTRSIFNSRPKIIELLPKILEQTDNICIKISPAFDYDEIKQLIISPEIEVISEENVNKGAFLWFGKFKTVKRRASILDAKKTISFTDNLPIANLDTSLELKKYLFLANKAIIKANLLDQVAVLYNLSKLLGNDEFLTADNRGVYPNRVFRGFKILDYSVFSMRRVKSLVKDKGLDRAHILSRHFGIKAEDLRLRLKLKEGGKYSLIFTNVNTKRYVILTENVD
ncbi:MAG: hypothetical protein EOM88_01615 [Clostridia bacterium]|nr:hypothetical protein [Clostridia bacterium]